MKFEDLEEKDCILQIEQKGVDMRIGLDIASLAYKKQVDQIVLISGDSDFVSAAKLARREGIDFILDPLGAPVKPDLFEHIDGLRTCDSNFKISDKK
ncbi:MAG TPA: NYN domain-containing protein [Coprobacillaceae bacterium]|uniref:NYN domain-containing protein n=1 Tax=Faecalibacillus intestinalis TaxID=1982626 RepID=UPI00295EFB8E|nr:NYN domain-containing protein [Faecalibacillus intestinalis]HJI20742.1 NYN domain-containing protein [Coprobacillaceae bacterium]